MMRSLIPLTAILALAASCERRADAPEAPASSRPEAATPAPTTVDMTPIDLSSPATVAEAFRVAWGAAPPVEQPDEEGAAFRYSAGRLMPLGGDRYALISDGAGGEGHVNPGALSIHYLRRTAEGFERTGGWPNLVVGGTFGNPPQWSIRQDLTPAPALVAESGGTWQGYTCSMADVVELTPDRPVVRAAGIRMDFSSGGALGDRGEDLDGALTAGELGRSFRVQYAGASDTAVDWVRGPSGVYAARNEPADLPWC